MNTELASLTVGIQMYDDHLRDDRQQLASAMATRYVMQDQGLPAESMPSTQTVGQLTTLAQSVLADRDNIAGLRQRQVDRTKEVSAAMTTLLTLNRTLTAQQAVYQAQSAALNGTARALNDRIANAQAEIASLNSGSAGTGSAAAGGWTTQAGALPPFAFGSRFDAYPWGQCTWYVASLRTVPWSGDAWAWAGNAARMGYAEGMTPRVGSIVVWGAGNGYSQWGHVAYVTAVNGPNDFVVSESNYLGLGVVNLRHITTLRDVEAFIY